MIDQYYNVSLNKTDEGKTMTNDIQTAEEIVNTEIQEIKQTIIVGIGGGGINVLDYLIKNDLKGVQFLVVHTDQEALNKSKATGKILIGSSMTNGKGSGGNPSIARKAAIKDQAILANALKNTNMAIIIAGMGGGNGTGAAPIIAQIARKNKAFTVGIVSTPFFFEGHLKMTQTKEGICRLREAADDIVIISNDKISENMNKSTSIKTAMDYIKNAFYLTVIGLLPLQTG
jgi:cell division protein FtsZ